jgi:hypothetical protein
LLGGSARRNNQQQARQDRNGLHAPESNTAAR